MKTLLDKYKTKLIEIDNLISNNKNNGSIMDIQRAERFLTRKHDTQKIIDDIELSINNDNDITISKIEYVELLNFKLDSLRLAQEQDSSWNYGIKELELEIQKYK